MAKKLKNNSAFGVCVAGNDFCCYLVKQLYHNHG